TIRALISNVGRFDSFVRSEAKALVGPRQTADKLSLRINRMTERAKEDSDDRDDDLASPYMEVKSRTSLLVTFFSRPPTEVRQQLHGAYSSGQAFLRMGILASAGALESSVLSQTVPFSQSARADFEKKVDTMNLSF